MQNKLKKLELNEGDGDEDDRERRPLLAHTTSSVCGEEAVAEAGGGDAVVTCWDPRAPFYRYFALIFICLLTFGPYFCYVLPGALEKEFERDLAIDTTQFTVFVSLYSWPNVVLCLVGGYLVDNVLGIRFGAILFSLFVTVGQLLFAYGAFVNNLSIMYVGRFLFGMGGEAVSVAQKAYLVAWFASDELNLVFGFIASSALLGSSLNQLLMGPIYQQVSEYFDGHECLGAAILVASTTIVFSMLCALLLSPLDKRRTRFLKRQQPAHSHALIIDDEKDDQHEAGSEEGENNHRQIIITRSWACAFMFPLEFWLMVVVCITFYSATFPFISLGKLFFIKKYASTDTFASLQQSVFFFATVITSPIFGKIVDTTGFNLLWVIGSIVIATASHCLLMFTNLESLIPVVALGVALSVLYASLWPMVALIVNKSQLGTAYGLMQSFQNLGLAVFSIVTGFLVDNYGYYVLELFFLCLCLVGLIAALMLYFVDKTRNGNLCVSAKDQPQRL